MEYLFFPMRPCCTCDWPGNISPVKRMLYMFSGLLQVVNALYLLGLLMDYIGRIAFCMRLFFR